MKLTVAQADLLVRVSERVAGHPCSIDYRPAKKLMELGLCDGRSRSFGGLKLVLTEAGLAELERRAKGNGNE